VSEKPELKLTAKMSNRSRNFTVVQIELHNNYDASVTLRNATADELLRLINSHAALLEACKDMHAELKSLSAGDEAFYTRETEMLGNAQLAIRAAEPEKKGEPNELLFRTP